MGEFVKIAFAHATPLGWKALKGDNIIGVRENFHINKNNYIDCL